ncbi:hypothetical protein Tco_0980710 [Tanacetum coccineum]
MGTCPSSLLANKVALMLSVEAARYIIRTSPCIGVVSIGKVSKNFFISWSVAAASCVHCMFLLSVQLLSTLKKGRDLSAPFDRNRLRAANFPLRLCMSLSIFGCLESDSSRLLLSRRTLSCPHLPLPFGSDGSLCRHLGSTFGGIPRGILPSNQSRAEGNSL